MEDLVLPIGILLHSEVCRVAYYARHRHIVYHMLGRRRVDAGQYGFFREPWMFCTYIKYIFLSVIIQDV